MDTFSRGLIDTKDLVYYGSAIALALFLTLCVARLEAVAGVRA